MVSHWELTITLENKETINCYRLCCIPEVVCDSVYVQQVFIAFV